MLHIAVSRAICLRSMRKRCGLRRSHKMNYRQGLNFTHYIHMSRENYEVWLLFQIFDSITKFVTKFIYNTILYFTHKFTAQIIQHVRHACTDRVRSRLTLISHVRSPVQMISNLRKFCSDSMRSMRAVSVDCRIVWMPMLRAQKHIAIRTSRVSINRLR